jgi:hypothetical protein
LYRIRATFQQSYLTTREKIYTGGEVGYLFTHFLSKTSKLKEARVTVSLRTVRD